MIIHRTKYFVPTPNGLWHIDSGHKLIRYQLITHVCIDGKTKLLIYASYCNNNNKADTVMSFFQKGVEEWVLPSRVRCDYGMENVYVGQDMIDHRGQGRGSIITGSSVHTTPELRELIGTFTLGCRLFMHTFLKQWRMRHS